jgi:hypothetical protein
MSHRTGIGTVTGKREGRVGPQWTNDTIRRAVSLFLRLHKYKMRDDAGSRWRPKAGDRLKSREANGLSSARIPRRRNRTEALRHTRLISAIPRDHPAELTGNRPVPTGGEPEPGPDPAKPPRCGVPVADGRLLAAVSPRGDVMRQARGDETSYRAMRVASRAQQSRSIIEYGVPGTRAGDHGFDHERTGP